MKDADFEVNSVQNYYDHLGTVLAKREMSKGR